ncbi:MAG: nodulation protein NfeD [Lentisphaerae bacterium]|nr:nodulation protein NfeD [Lentisphaerota bacterium]
MESEGPVYVIPVKDMIERGLVYVVRRGVAAARREGASVIIFDMHTPGGRLDAAEEIVHIIANVGIETCTFVNRDAISAGAIIALGTDRIYMAPGSRIGDAMPLMMSPFGAPQEMSEALEEKAVSYVAGLIRSTAQRKKHDAKLAEAMVRREMEYKIGDRIICPEGQLLTLTNVEAEQVVEEDGQQRKLLSSGTVDDIPALLKRIGQDGATIKTFEISPAETFARYIEMFSALFLVGGLLGVYIEFKTPGFGIPGLTGVLLLAIWYWGHHVAGLAGMGELLLLVTGITFLFVEIFVIPGFGVVGITGLILIVVSLMMAMVQHYPGHHWYQPPEIHLAGAIRVLGSSLLTTFVLGLILARFLPKAPIFQRLMLKTAETADSGYTASRSTEDLLGLLGVAETPLRPAGIGSFNDQRLNVVARGQFIEKGAPIVVAESHGNRIVVESPDAAADDTETA